MDSEKSKKMKKIADIASLIILAMIALAISVAMTVSLEKSKRKVVAQSGVISKAYAGCVTEDALSEMTSAAIRKDDRQMSALLIAGSCTLLAGRKYSIVDQGFITSEIRVYDGLSSALLFVPSEALQRIEAE